MQCPKCGYEPRNLLLSSPCPNPECSYIWWDTQDYVKWLADDLEINSVLDIGCGNKGAIAYAYWQNVKKVKKAYACDRHVIKKMEEPWVPLLMDAEKLPEYFKGEQIDFVTHCGLIEHIEYEKAFRVLEVIEKVAKKRVYFTFSAFLREVDYKVKLDGNPYHYYKSFWDARTIEALGYYVDRERMAKRITFVEEVTGWFDPKDITVPFEERKQKAIASIIDRKCEYCDREPIIWNAEIENQDVYLCLSHLREKHDRINKICTQLDKWFARRDIEEIFPVPPWRKKRKVL